MRVHFTAYGVLSQAAPGGAEACRSLEVPDGATVAQLFDQLGLTWGEIGIIRVNGRLADEEAVLQEGDEVSLFAPIGGGEGPLPRAGSRATVLRMTLARRVWLRVVARLKELLAELLPKQLNLSWVTGSLAVGGEFRSRDIPRLVAQEVGAVVDMRAEAADDAAELARHGIAWLHLPVEDRHAPTQEQLVEGVAWVRARQAEGRKVLIHCAHGVGRAPVLAVAVMISQGESPLAALGAIQARRWQASPNDRQLEAVLRYAQALLAGRAVG